MKPGDPGDQDPKDPQDNEKNPVQYFVPGQVVLQLTHPADVSSREVAEALGRFIREPSQEHGWKQELAPPEPEAVLTFSREAGQEASFSIASTRLARQDASQDEQVRLLVEIFKQLDEKPVSIASGQTPILLRSVSPNWLVGGVRHQVGLGGPGDWPDEASLPPDSWPEFKLPGAVKLQDTQPGEGEGVHVAILDTAPCLHDLDEAYDEWQGKGHPLLESLLGPDSPLRVYPASYADLRLTGNYSLLEHRYLMADHGLFVAGVIHTLARKARLHLYEVLNPYGVGCVETIAQGLLNALTNPAIGRPLIVNCSLVLDLPREGESFPDFPAELADPSILKHMRMPVEALFDALSKAKGVAVAAAGNDASRQAVGSPGAGRPPARFPAAFPSVIGVGAVQKGRPSCGNRFKAASYSNLADDLPWDGYMTLGGESGKDGGMLGLFIGKYPNPADKGKPDPHTIGYLPNGSGWARWAGTSFATPIVSGILATWWDASLSPASDAARTVLGKTVTGATDEGEQVIYVEQQ